LRTLATIGCIDSVAVVLVALTVIVHFAFVAYLVAGGFLALKWRWALPLHGIAVAWGIGSDALRWPCPLTSMERWARAGAGMGPLPPDGFIAHYITGVLYPADAVGVVRVLACAIVLMSWMLVLANRRRFRSRPYWSASTGTISVPHEHR
jgi:Protein of Unknown function (DUF2784)